MKINNVKTEVVKLELFYQDIQKALTICIEKDENLRNEFIKAPKATIEKELGIKFDDNIKINIVNQKNDNEITFVLPINIHENKNKELNDKQLEESTGGIVLQAVAMKTADLLGANSEQKKIVKTVSGVVDFFVPL